MVSKFQCCLGSWLRSPRRQHRYTDGCHHFQSGRFRALLQLCLHAWIHPLQCQLMFFHHQQASQEVFNRLLKRTIGIFATSWLLFFTSLKAHCQRIEYRLNRLKKSFITSWGQACRFQWPDPPPRVLLQVVMHMNLCFAELKPVLLY